MEVGILLYFFYSFPWLFHFPVINNHFFVQSIGMYNTNSCNQDARDCFEFNEKYPRCAVTAQAVMDERLTNDTIIMQYVPIIGDDICNSGLYNNADCGYEDGDVSVYSYIGYDIFEIY